MEGNTNNGNLDEIIQLSILEYREREKQRYLRYKNNSIAKKTQESNKEDVKTNAISIEDCSNNRVREINSFENSKKSHSSICNVNQGSSSCLCGYSNGNSLNLLDNQQPVSTTTNLIERNNNCSINLASETINSRINAPNLDSEGIERDSNNTERTRKAKNFRQSPGIFNSIKTWTTSIVSRSSKSQNTHRNSRSSRCSHIDANGPNSSVQQNNAVNNSDRNVGFQNSGYLTDEELARRIQIEEFNTINALGATESHIYYPSYQGFDTLHDILPIQITCSSNESMKPFKGPEYNIETLKLSDDESEETSNHQNEERN
ncbi:hypothetical protein RS030_152355 [Cryptosporidium xiaoi]|uniref:Uncharacterized protein n=1 Tax=Cryptosporidium xiaoi TaxID=659607 RepID=A0AAV9Y2F4_9CRYT